jgi:hypothetical protein
VVSYGAICGNNFCQKNLLRHGLLYVFKCIFESINDNNYLFTCVHADVFREAKNKPLVGMPVTEKLLNAITKDIKDKWKFLGRYLALDESTIQAIKADNYQIREQAHQMLMKWKQKYANRATTQVLIKALKDVGKENVAKRVQGECVHRGFSLCK